jgi:hypothetical protein
MDETIKHLLEALLMTREQLYQHRCSASDRCLIVSSIWPTLPLPTHACQMARKASAAWNKSALITDLLQLRTDPCHPNVAPPCRDACGGVGA